MIKWEHELRKLKIEFEASDGKIKTLCPFHEDTNASCQLDIVKNRYRCWSCKSAGDLTYFLAKVRKETVAETRHYIGKVYGITLAETIDASLVEDCHQEIWTDENASLRKELHNRGVTDELISQYRLGVQNKRITIPVKNEEGFYVSLRLYNPGASDNKFTSLPGYGGNFLYPRSQLSYERIIIVGGEIKAIAVAGALNEYGYGAVSGTHGEGEFKSEWLVGLNNKELFVCTDDDGAGEKASTKLCGMLYGRAKEVRLDFSGSGIKKGGIDDYLVWKSPADLVTILEKSSISDAKPVDVVSEEITLHEAFQAKNAAKVTTYTCTVTHLGENSFLIPREVVIQCPRGKPFCLGCSVNLQSDGAIHTIEPDSIGVINMAKCNKLQQPLAIRDALGIPEECKLWSHDTQTHQSVEEVRISPELKIDDRDVDREMLPAYVTLNGKDKGSILPNETYKFTGRVWPSPRDQQATAVIKDYELVESALDSYKADTSKLSIFQPEEWSVEGLREKLHDIYEDLEANVTLIFQRREIHLLTDLAYHSPLFFTFNKRRENGWVSVLVVGDSSCGKSLTTERLMEHYKLGDSVECGQVTAAGIIGGLDKLSGSFFVTWGALATQDKRLLKVDELSEAPEDLMGKMNDSRSSGMVRLHKIKKASAKARTRTIFISNPVRGNMEKYNRGVEAIRDLIPHPQYIRRFDAAIIVNKNDIDARELNFYRPERPHKYTSELCNELVLWAWTVEKVVFEDEMEVLKLASEMTEEFSEEIPLVDVGSFRLKLARLSAALAARTFSTLDDGKSVYVRNVHVQFVLNFLRQQYNKESFGYASFSQALMKKEKLTNPDMILDYIIREFPDPRTFVEGCLETNNVDVNFIVDYGGVDKLDAQTFLGMLVRGNAVARTPGGKYFKSSTYVRQLQTWESNGVFGKIPKHVQEAMDKDTL